MNSAVISNYRCKIFILKKLFVCSDEVAQYVCSNSSLKGIFKMSVCLWCNCFGRKCIVTINSNALINFKTLKFYQQPAGSWRTLLCLISSSVEDCAQRAFHLSLMKFVMVQFFLLYFRQVWGKFSSKDVTFKRLLNWVLKAVLLSQMDLFNLYPGSDRIYFFLFLNLNFPENWE